MLVNGSLKVGGRRPGRACCRCDIDVDHLPLSGHLQREDIGAHELCFSGQIRESIT